jgi:hypothetical protein
MKEGSRTMNYYLTLTGKDKQQYYYIFKAQKDVIAAGIYFKNHGYKNLELLKTRANVNTIKKYLNSNNYTRIKIDYDPRKTMFYLPMPEKENRYICAVIGR